MSRRRAGYTAEEWSCLSGLAHPYSILSIEAGVPKVVTEGIGDWAEKAGQFAGGTVARLKQQPSAPSGEPGASSGEKPAKVPKEPKPVKEPKSSKSEKDPVAARRAWLRKQARRRGRKADKPERSPGRRFLQGIKQVITGTGGAVRAVNPVYVKKRRYEDKLWRAFLSECQVDESMFRQLVVEAERGEDSELVDEVLAFEEAFAAWRKDFADEHPDPEEERVTEDRLERFGIPLQEWNKLAGLADAYAVDEGAYKFPEKPKKTLDDAPSRYKPKIKPGDKDVQSKRGPLLKQAIRKYRRGLAARYRRGA